MQGKIKNILPVCPEKLHFTRKLYVTSLSDGDRIAIHLYMWTFSIVCMTATDVDETYVHIDVPGMIIIV